MGDPGAESGRYDEYVPILGVGGGRAFQKDEALTAQILSQESLIICFI